MVKLEHLRLAMMPVAHGEVRGPVARTYKRNEDAAAAANCITNDSDVLEWLRPSRRQGAGEMGIGACRDR